jgi:release factor glutamine methyltransferase
VTDLAERRDVETEVYQPAEDSALLASTVVDRIEDGDRVLEVGTGSGWIAEQIAAETGASVVASDVNPHACVQARERGLAVARTDLVAGFRDGAFDVVVFNPPYLPEDAAAAREDWMEQALSGGESGRAVVEPFVASVARVLADDGVAFMLVSSLTGVDEVVAFAGECGFSVVAIADESYPFETLTVLELVPASSAVQ